MIVNDDFDAALMDFRAIIRAERLKEDKQAAKYSGMLALYWRNNLDPLDFH